MAKTDAAGEKRNGGSQLSEGYPSLAKVLHAVGQDKEIPNVGVRRVEVSTFASGEATYKVVSVDSEEEIGGYLSREQLA
jgi:hypothetical protein